MHILWIWYCCKTLSMSSFVCIITSECVHVCVCVYRKCKVYLSNDIIKPFNKFVFLLFFLFFLLLLLLHHHHDHHITTQNAHRAQHECHLIACNPRRCVRPFTLIYFHNTHCLLSFMSSTYIHAHRTSHIAHIQ